MEKKGVSCIIPAYNEGKRIGDVLKIVSNHPHVDELIVIDDGSTDNTKNIVKNFRKAKLLINKENKGKGYTIMRGLEVSRNKIVMFIDADLIGLNKENITQLVLPVKKGKADFTISMRNPAAKCLGLDIVSGERVFHKSLIKDFKKLEKMKGFELEPFLNREIIKNKLKLKIVHWNNVESPFPTKKKGFFKGMKQFIKLGVHIVKEIGIFGVPYQIIKLRSLRVKDEDN